MASDQSDESEQNQSLWEEACSSWARFQQSGKREDLDTAITLQQAALDCCHPCHPDRDSVLYNLALFLYSRYERWGNVEDLETSIRLGREALELRPEGHPGRSLSLGNLAISLRTCFEHRGRMEDLEEAIVLERAALELRPEGHPGRSLSLGNLAGSLWTCFEHCGRMEDLEEAIELNRAALELRPEGHPDRSLSLGNLASCLRICFEHRGRMEDLEEAIVLNHATLELRPVGHPDRSLSLGNLANSLRTCFEHRSRMEDLEEAIVLERAALELRPEGHPLRSLSLANLAISLRTCFVQCGRIENLEEAIELNRAALELRPEGHPDRSSSLGNLANSLWTCFQHRGRMEDLEEAIELNRAALELRPEGHPDRSSSLGNLANSLRTCFEHRGRMEDLEEAIELNRATLELRPVGHPDCSLSLGNLANSLQTCFEHRGRMEDLEEAIELNRAALELRPEDHPDRSLSLGNLASCLRTCFEHRGRMEDLEEAIELNRATLELRPVGHPDRSLSLGNLANSLRTCFEHRSRMEDLEEAIELNRAALELRPEDHPDRSLSLGNLASCLWTCFEHRGRMEDLEEAIVLERAALELRPEGHPDRSKSLRGIAECLHVRFQKEGSIDDLEESIKSLDCGAAHKFSSVSSRLACVYRWIAIARSHDHHTCLEAYRTAMSLLQRALTIRPTLSSQHQFLSSNSHLQVLALDAASCAIDKGKLTQAVEILEQGRALLWSQVRGLRTPLDQLSEVNKGLGERFEGCSRGLEALIVPSGSRMSGSGTEGSVSHAYSTSQERTPAEQMFVEMRRLSEEQETIINEIRQIPGFEGFLRSAPFDALQQAASEGPVIMLNHSEYRSDVLIILSSKDEPCVCIPLDPEFYSDSVELHKEFIHIRGAFGVGSKKYDGILRRVMKVLWDRVVSRVVEKLKEMGITEGSRIWWCPTSVLTAFPFHAAGPYTDTAGKTKYLLDDYISSYAPTLTSLITSRCGVQDGDRKMLFVGDTQLPSANRERHAINGMRCIDKQLLDKRASPDMVIKALRKVEWVHFVCHGILGKEPFDSSLKLPGGRLTLLDIVWAHLPNAEFAFLSACHSAEQGPTTALDESLHLSAAMQFCGFRSVVGTMWKLLDRDGPFLSGVVYARLMDEVEEGEMRFKRAAGAVREAALRLRERKEDVVDGKEVDIMAERWVNLVHIGA
ncbi:hypothetical protein ACEPAI_9810 [Sanghuangporus weigelae]